ncbi:phenylcoumaran benzylic ether reductase POP1-like [Telopea speciosissima]|uniref:phenylcoumaran benzylic ether reductase POP1-like n=1 Tax=Telopea speciosissima TaxID=54955 RepID=UPI001CC78AD7|nr:phenylcoumaran benzylic ether reductase POP1-like [Telopea speciosissima]
MASKSKILIIGGTGYIGKFIVEASAKSGHPTFALLRDTEAVSGTDEKSKLLQSFKNSGVTFLQGDLNDHESLVKAIKQVDVVIVTVGKQLVQEQVKIIAAIKEAGNVKRFFPSEFGNDADRIQAVEPALSTYMIKASIRRVVESEGIPYTFVVNNHFGDYFFRTFGQDGATAPPREKIVIMGDGNPKVVYNNEEDIGTYTIKAVDDPRTLNKILYIKPPGNILSFNEVVSLWEKKIGKTLEKVYIPGEQVLKNIQGATFPANLVMSLNHAVFVSGVKLEIDPSIGVEASELYPEVKYASVDEQLNKFV